MILPRPSPSYDSQNEAQARAVMTQADEQNLKRGRTIEFPPAAAIIMTSSNGTRYQMGVSNAGTTTWTAL